MLHKSYCDVGYDLADEMVYVFRNPFTTKVAGKLTDAMFNLKEIEGELLYQMESGQEVEVYANKGVVSILLSPVLEEVLSDDDELDEYVNAIISVCNVNRRLKYAFLMYKLTEGKMLLEHECGGRAASILKKISNTIANQYK